MSVFRPKGRRSVPRNEGQTISSSMMKIDMSLEEFQAFSDYMQARDRLWIEGYDMFPPLDPGVAVTMPVEDLGRFRSYQKAPLRYEIKAPFGIRYDLKEFLGAAPGFWRAMGVIAGVLLLFLVLPFVAYIMLCLGFAVVDGDFDLGAALVSAFM